MYTIIEILHPLINNLHSKKAPFQYANTHLICICICILWPLFGFIERTV